MNRPYLFKLKIYFFLILINFPAFAAEISFTIDDPEVSQSPLFSPEQRNKKILDALDKHKVKGALFVCGMRIDNSLGKSLLRSWDQHGHMIANHSYSHLYFHSKKVTFETYCDDFLKVEPLISGFKNFERFFRFPFLKEGDTKEKRDAMRAELKAKGYRQGYVSIDASDWYIDMRLRKRLAENSKIDLKPYRDFYLNHIWNRATFYNDLAKKNLGREVKHTLLIHHNLLNALFLDDLILMFKNKRWKPISAKNAYNDPIFITEPNILPAGESIVWAIAKEKGKSDRILRYPAEDGEYEKDEMDRLGL
jgi:hypothetical protein